MEHHQTHYSSWHSYLQFEFGMQSTLEFMELTDEEKGSDNYYYWALILYIIIVINNILLFQSVSYHYTFHPEL